MHAVRAPAPLSCAPPSGNFAFSTMDPNNPVYWAERWELFKHTYVVAGWGWKRAITKVEYWVRHPGVRGPPLMCMP